MEGMNMFWLLVIRPKWFVNEKFVTLVLEFDIFFSLKELIKMFYTSSSFVLNKKNNFLYKTLFF